MITRFGAIIMQRILPTAVMLVALSTIATAGKPDICPELDEVRYSSPTHVPLKERLIISRLDSAIPWKADAQVKSARLVSPLATAQLVFLSMPDFMKNPPWNTKVAVIGNEARPISLSIEVKDHGNSNTVFHWLNEKLLFVKVQWGRIVNTSLILNIETGEPIYEEDETHVFGLSTCEEKRRLLKSTAPRGK